MMVIEGNEMAWVGGNGVKHFDKIMMLNIFTETANFLPSRSCLVLKRNHIKPHKCLIKFFCSQTGSFVNTEIFQNPINLSLLFDCYHIFRFTHFSVFIQLNGRKLFGFFPPNPKSTEAKLNFNWVRRWKENIGENADWKWKALNDKLMAHDENDMFECLTSFSWEFYQ